MSDFTLFTIKDAVFASWHWNPRCCSTTSLVRCSSDMPDDDFSIDRGQVLKVSIEVYRTPTCFAKIH